METRRTDILITYENKDISFDLKPYLKSFSYTDCASGEADRISLGIADFEGKWLNAWFPEKTDKITAAIVARNWRWDGDEWKLHCGDFTVDNVSFDGPPVALSLEAISTPISGNFNCRKNSKTWEKTTLQSIAGQIATNSGIALVYEGSAISIKVLEQSEETDMAFLEKLCLDYGLAMKAYSNKLIIFDEEVYEGKASVGKIALLDVIRWSGNTTLTGTANKAIIKYRDPKTGKNVTYTYTTRTQGKSDRTIEVNAKADSLADAMTKAKAELRKANREETTLNLTIAPLEGLVATQCVDISGFGKFDGKYFIEKITHSIDNGYLMDLEVRKVG